MAHGLTVFIVDDDAGILDSLKALIEAEGFTVAAYGSARKFLDDGGHLKPGCLLADVRMPEMSGLELQQELNRRGAKLPVVIMTGHGDVPLAVGAMKAGAVDFLEKPFDDRTLMESVHRAMEHGMPNEESRAIEGRVAQLTERERQVLDLLVLGKANKVIAYDLSISPRTVEIHRARVMDKMAARNLAELVRMVLLIRPPA